MKNLIPPADRETISKLNLKDPWIWLATWFGLGFLRPGPGTWGTLGGLPVGLMIYKLGGVWALVVAIIVVTRLGYIAAIKFSQQTETNDHAMIVVDEVVGIWIALLGAGLSPPLIFIAFMSFRAFDITKPLHVGNAERLPGAIGVMADDIAAGVYSFILLWLLYYGGLG